MQEEYENGNAFYGTKGWLETLRAEERVARGNEGGLELTAYQTDFSNAIRNEEALASAGHVAIGFCHIIGIEPKSERILGGSAPADKVKRQWLDGHFTVPK